MQAHDRHPGIQKYREARRQAKIVAIKRNEVLRNNPSLSQKQATAIAERALQLS